LSPRETTTTTRQHQQRPLLLLRVLLANCYCNGAACCSHLNAWGQAGDMAQQCLDGLDRIVNDDDNAFEEEKRLGELQIKAMLVLSRALVRQGRTKDAMEILRSARNMIRRQSSINSIDNSVRTRNNNRNDSEGGSVAGDDDTVAETIVGDTEEAVERALDRTEKRLSLSMRIARSPIVGAVHGSMDRVPEDGVIGVGMDALSGGASLLGRWLKGGVRTAFSDLAYATNLDGRSTTTPSTNLHTTA